MEPSSLLAISIANMIKQSFTSVFRDSVVATESWFQKVKLKSTTRDRYTSHILENVGTFPLFGTTKHASVESCYVRVAVSEDLERERYRPAAQIEAGLRRQRKGKHVTPKRQTKGVTLFEILEGTSKGVALLGGAGTGKTTILRQVSVELAKGKKLRGQRRLPIYLAIRDLAVRKQGIKDASVQFLKWLKIQETEKVFDSLLRSGDFAILIDGLDEVESRYQTQLLNEVEGLRARCPRAIFCISARPYTLSRSVSGFKKCETLPLDFQERLVFIRKWYKQVDEQKGKQLVQDCRGKPGLIDLGSNPLLLSIVCALYFNDLKIPQEPDELYDRMVEGLLGAWDVFRNIARNTVLRDLSVRRRVALTSWLSAAMFEKGHLVFDARDVERDGCIDRFARSSRSTPLDAVEVLHSLYSDFGLLVERAPRLFSFSHLTLQEYLTALFTVDNRRELDLLQSYRTSPGWFEVIRLVTRMLPRADEFIEFLTKETQLENPYEVNLLMVAWQAKPICDPHLSKKLIMNVVSRTVNAANKVPAQYENDEHTLFIKIQGFKGSVSKGLSLRGRKREVGLLNRKRRRIKKPVDILQNLAAIQRIIEAAGFNFSGLGVGNVEPFRSVIWMPSLESVHIEGF